MGTELNKAEGTKKEKSFFGFRTAQWVADTLFDLHIQAEAKEKDQRDLFQRIHDRITGRGPAAKLTAAGVVTGAGTELVNQLLIGSITLTVVNAAVTVGCAGANLGIRAHRWNKKRKAEGGRVVSDEEAEEMVEQSAMGELTKDEDAQAESAQFAALWMVAKDLGHKRNFFTDLWSQYKGKSFKSEKNAAIFNGVLRLAEAEGKISFAPAI